VDHRVGLDLVAKREIIDIYIRGYELKKKHHDIYFIVYHFHHLRYKKTKRNKKQDGRTGYCIIEQTSLRNRAMY
jgi:hypothetical protein